MKFQHKPREVIKGGVKQTTKAKILANREAFNILSNRLYSDKILAVIRELSTNAYDAHVEAKNMERTFDVKLPTMLDPVFRIRDYGTGLSHDDVMDLYNTYFHSTKTDTNEAVGALGLGSKSPYSYTTVFSVISYFNGKRRIYNCGLDEDGCPECSYISESDTDEHNGLEVSFSVNKSDFREFNIKAGNIYSRFKLKPNISGKMDCYDDNLPEIILEGDNWRVRGGGRWERKQVAIMGMIAYPIKVSNLTANSSNSDDDETKLAHKYQKIFENLNIELDFNIGDLDIAANREDLGYNNETSKLIIRRIVESVKAVIDDYSNKIHSAPNYLEAHRIFCSLDTIGQEIRNQVDLYYKEKPLNTAGIFLGIRAMMKEEIDKLDIDSIVDEEERKIEFNNAARELSSKKQLFTITAFGNLKAENTEISLGRNTSTNGYIITTHLKARLLVTKEPRIHRIRAKVKYYMDQHEVKEFNILTIADDNLYQRVIDFLDFGGELLTVDDLIDPPKEAREYSSNRDFNLMKLNASAAVNYTTYNRNRGSTFTMCLHKAPAESFDLDDDGEYYFVIFNRNSPVNGINAEFDCSINQMGNIVKLLKEFGHDIEVFGIGSSQESLIPTLPGNWTNLYKFLSTVIKQELKSKNLIQRVNNSEMKKLLEVACGDILETDTASLMSTFKRLSKHLDDDEGKFINDAIKKLSEITSAEPVSTNESKLLTLAEDIGIDYTSKIDVEFEQYNDIICQIDNRYGALFEMRWPRRDYFAHDKEKIERVFKRTLDYVKTIEACKK